jgi:hypothetical protein
MPSADLHASRTEAGNVVPSRFRHARPITCVSKARPRDNFTFSSCRISRVAAEISGPIPSPGSTTNRIIIRDLSVIPRTPLARSNAKSGLILPRRIIYANAWDRRLQGPLPIRLIFLTNQGPSQRVHSYSIPLISAQLIYATAYFPSQIHVTGDPW